MPIPVCDLNGTNYGNIFDIEEYTELCCYVVFCMCEGLASTCIFVLVSSLLGVCIDEQCDVVNY